LENGWESFTVNQTKKDKVTGEKVKEEIEMAASVMVDGAHVFGDSVTEKKPTGVQLNHKHAMSLSSQRWTKKTQTGTHEELYDEFLAQYDAEAVEEEVKEKPAKVAVVRKTAAEKEAEMQKKKEEREAAAKEKKEAREAAAKEKKEEREAAAKQKKEEAAAKKTEKPVKAAVVKAVASPKTAAVKVDVKVAAKAPVAAKAVTPVKVAAPVKAPAAPQKKKAEEVWSCEDDGCVAPWSYKGKKYMRDFGNNVWVNTNNLPGDWCGVYIPSEDRIDDSKEEPLLEEE
jgi:hypothetical protein